MFNNSTFGTRRDPGDDEINLTPMMNLFVVLIPFLLMSTAFLKLSIINAAVPTIAESVLEPGQSDKILNVSLRIESDGFHISGSGDNLSNMELASVNTQIRKLRSDYDHAGLTQALSRIKWRFPKGKTVLLFPDKHIRYETIIQAMDASRWTQASAGKERAMLYPEVVLTSVVEVE